jgi:hypothetical protein
MIPHQFFYLMVVLGLLWLFFLLHIPTVSPAKNSLACFISITSIDHPAWRGHREEAKRGPPSGHRITRNEGAILIIWILRFATHRLTLADFRDVGVLGV